MTWNFRCALLLSLAVLWALVTSGCEAVGTRQVLGEPVDEHGYSNFGGEWLLLGNVEWRTVFGEGPPQDAWHSRSEDREKIALVLVAGSETHGGPLSLTVKGTKGSERSVKMWMRDFPAKMDAAGKRMSTNSRSETAKEWTHIMTADLGETELDLVWGLVLINETAHGTIASPLIPHSDAFEEMVKAGELPGEKVGGKVVLGEMKPSDYKLLEPVWGTSADDGPLNYSLFANAYGMLLYRAH